MRALFTQQQSRRGVVVAWTAVAMVMLLSMAALALDTGYLYNVKADLQNAADAAALAAAITMVDVDGLNPSAAYDTALRVAARNMDVSHSAAARMMDFTIGRYDDPLDHTLSFVPAVDETSNAVRVVLHRTKGRGHPVRLFFAAIFGKHESDVSVLAVSGRANVNKAPLLPIALRAPGFGPVDPDVEEHNPGKDGPAYPDNGESFVLGEKVTVFAFGKGPRQQVHLTLDLEEFNGVNGTNAILQGTYEVIEGRYPEIMMGIGDQYYVQNAGTGNQNFGQKLLTRMNDGNESNDTVLLPIVRELPDSRDADGKLTGKVEIADIVGVHLDRVEQVTFPDLTTDNPNDTITIEILVGTVVPAPAHGALTSVEPTLAEGVFSPILLR